MAKAGLLKEYEFQKSNQLPAKNPIERAQEYRRNVEWYTCQGGWMVSFNKNVDAHRNIIKIIFFYYKCYSQCALFFCCVVVLRTKTVVL